ncbi:MAG TPA: DoxX family protein [Chitinophagaceae bacterium]
METTTTSSKKMKIMGWVLSILAILLLLADGFGKLIKPEPVVKATLELGYPENTIVTIGVLVIICTIIYTIPRSALLGAILLTGFLGGAIATHFRINNPLFSHTLFPVYVLLFIWLGLYLRSASLRKLLLNS